MQVSGSGSMSTVSEEGNLVFSSEDSSTPEEPELELGLGIGIGIGVSSSSSSASSALSRACKRRADSVAPTANGPRVCVWNYGNSQVVGWPPIRAYRMNSLVSQAKSQAAVTEQFNPMEEENQCSSSLIRKAKNGDEKKKESPRDNGRAHNSLFVKVNMDGIPIGRKIDLSTHSGYEALAHTLVDMFNYPGSVIKSRSIGKDLPSKLLDGSSEHVLTYEDKDGDWMLVGDVPWGMFLGCVKRLRIMRTLEANGLSPRLQERNGRQRCQPN